MEDHTDPVEVEPDDPIPCHLRGIETSALFEQVQQSSTQQVDPDKNFVLLDSCVNTLAPDSGAAELPWLAHALQVAVADGRSSSCSTSSNTTGYSLQSEGTNNGGVVHQVRS